MSYQVLARKWRPKAFDALVGQEHVVRALTNALQQQRLHHAYLFTGTRGVGKTTLARILAKSMNCETGITATPCGQCAACLEIDKGRFVDLVEVDAASNTQVDSMRDLLDSAQYAPTAGRFKIYIIDEVHMLSRSAFNAMLKTLEEPPAHVKFILATTDPQKMPVTILSRCLQFNLRQMPGSAITDHLQSILQQENIPYEPVALQLIARSAAGSMRDALSLLDQAIAYGGDAVNEKDVRGMLGAIDQSYLFELLQSLIAQDGPTLMAQAKRMEQRSLSFDAALNDLANLLQQVAVAQTVPQSIAEDHPERELLLDLAARMAPDEVQLYYQIAILGRRDLGLAPDEFAGFTMCLLRMLAFSPANAAATGASPKPQSARAAIPSKTTAEARNVEAAPVAAATPEVAETAEKKTEIEPVAVKENQAVQVKQEEQISERPKKEFDGNWRNLVDQLKLGLARALAQNCELVRYDENAIYLCIPQAHKHLLDLGYQDKLRAVIEQYFGKRMQLHFEIGGTGNTPAQQVSKEKAALQSKAESAIQEDRFVQALVNEFGAQIISSSIKPVQ
ncbi:MAG TPA: DNA polymerase III subunit gamma/tau [Methylophilaceae bacterium]|nr:DNA polymerase III subunit gamma/tau [Methylophilaceae bacterium]